MTITPTHSAWQAITTLAALTHEPIRSLKGLVERLVALLPAETAYRQGALLLRSGDPADRSGALHVVASWGLAADELDALPADVPPPSDNGVVLKPTAKGLQLVELRTFGQRVGLLALGQPEGAALTNELLTALADQIAILCYAVQVANPEPIEHIEWFSRVTLIATELGETAGQVGLRHFVEEITLYACRLPYVKAAAVYLAEKPGRQPALVASATLDEIVPAFSPTLESLPAGADEPPSFFQTVLPLRDTSLDGGILVLVHPVDPRSQGKTYGEALDLFASQAALALRANRLAEAQRAQSRDLFILYENTRTLSNAPDLGATLDRLCGNVALALRSDHCAVFLWDDERKDLEIGGAFDAVNSLELGSFPVGERVKPESNAVLQTVLQTNRPLAVEDVATDPRLEQGRQNLLSFGFKAVLAAPLIQAERLLGILLVSSYNPRSYLAEEVTLIQTLAGQAAIAIGHARLLEDERRRSSELELLHNLSHDLSSGPSLQATLEALGRAIQRIHPKALYEICIFDADRQVLQPMVHSAVLGAVGDRSYTLDQGLTGWLGRHRRPLRVNDFTQKRGTRPLLEGALASKRIRAFVGVPLMVSDDLLGTLELASTQTNAFSADDERLLTIIAGQAAQALQQAIRYETADEVLRGRIRELTAIQRISRELISTLHIDRILTAVLDEARRATSASGGIVLLQNEMANFAKDLADTKVADANYDVAMVRDEGGTLRLIAVEGYSTEEQKALLTSLRQPNGLMHTLLTRGEPHIVDDIQVEEEALPLSTRSLLLVPIMYEEQVAGLITLGQTLAKSFNRDALNFVRALADQVALAIGNAQHFAELERQRELLQQRANLLNEVLEIGNALRADREIDDLLEQIAFSVVDAVGFRSVLFYLQEPGQPGHLRVFAGAGVPLAVLERMRQSPTAIAALHPLLDSRFRLGRAYFIPREELPDDPELQQLFLEHEASEEGAPGDWQPGDQFLVPLYSTEREMIGLMSVDDPFNSRRPGRRTADALEIFANQAAIALENARLFKEHERRIRYLSLLNEVGQRMSTVLSIDEIADLVLDGCVETFGFDYAIFSIVDEQAGEVHAVDCRNIAPEQMERCRQPLNSNDIMADVVRSQQLEIINGWDARFNRQLFEQFGHEKFRRAFVPLVIRNHSVGLLEVGYTDGVHQLTQDMIPVISTLANQTATAIDNARLFQERERQIHEAETLNRINQAITSTLDLEALLERLHTGLGEIIDVGTSFIGLYDPTQTLLSFPLAFQEGQPVKLDPVNITQLNDLNAWVIQHRMPLLLGSREDATPYHEGELEQLGSEQSYLITPIIAAEEVLGVINIRSLRQNAFSVQDLNFVTIVTVQAAAAIANAHLFHEREQSIHQLRMLNQIGQALGGNLRREDLLRMIYEQTSLLLDTTNFYIALFDDRRREVTFPLFYERGEHIHVPPVRQGNTLTEHVIKTGKPLLLNGSQIRAFLEQHRIEELGSLPQSWLGVPMIAANKVVGVICIQDYEHEYAYTEQEDRLLSTIASQAAQALENVLLFGESRESVRELSTLSETSVSLAGTLEMDEILTIGASSAMELTRSDFGGVYLINRQPGGDYEVSEAILLDSLHTAIETEGPRRRILQVLGKLNPLQEGQPLRVSDMHADPQLKAMGKQFGMRGLALLPITKDQGLRGALMVATLEPHEFEDRSLASLHILAAQVGQAMETASLFSQIKRFTVELEEMVAQRTQALAVANTELTSEKDRLEALYTIATELGATLDFNELLLRTLDLASRALNVQRGSILLRDRESGKLFCRAILRERGTPEATYYEVPFQGDQGLANWVISHPESEGVIIPDVRADSRWTIVEGRGDDIRSVIVVPLVTGEATEGVLFFSSTTSGSFTPDDLRLLRAIANEVSVALHNAELYSLIYDTADRLSTALLQQREEAGKSEAILRSISEGVIVLDTHGQIILYNPAAEHMLQIPAERVKGSTLQVFAEADAEGGESRSAIIYSGLSDGVRAVEQRNEISTSTLDLGSQIFTANFAPVMGADASRFGVVAVLRDITREIEADRAKREFISTVSHELRTPLTPIRGFVDLMLLGAAGQITDGQKEFLSTIKSNTMRMVSLVEDLLEIGRIESGKIKLNVGPTDLRSAIQETVKMLQHEVDRKEMEVSIEVAPDFPIIEADSKRIGQVVTNLISNAIKYTFPKGQIWIRAFKPSEDKIQFEVQDTGVGIKSEDMGKLFQRFFRTDNPLRDEVGGTGLGLSIAKSFVELHGGQMWVESVVNVGSTFAFSLPVRPNRPDLGERQDEGLGPIIYGGQGKRD